MITTSESDDSTAKDADKLAIVAHAKTRAVRAVFSGHYNVDLKKMRLNAIKEFGDAANIYIKKYEKIYKKALSKLDSSFIAKQIGISRGADAAKRGHPINFPLLHVKARKEFKNDVDVDIYIKAYSDAFDQRRKLKESKKSGLPSVRKRKRPAEEVPTLASKLDQEATKARKSPPIEASNDVVDCDEFILVSRAKITKLFDELRKQKDAVQQPSNHKRGQLRHSR